MLVPCAHVMNWCRAPVPPLAMLLQVVGTMGGGKVGTHFIKRLQQGWDVKTLLYYGASTCRCCLCYANHVIDSRS